jgi:hypothetical protein
MENNVEWFNVSCERFDDQRRRAVAASFVVKAIDRYDAVVVVDEYLAQACDGIYMSDWQPKTMADILDIPESGHSVARPLEPSESGYYDKVHGNHVRLVNYRQMEPSD